MLFSISVHLPVLKVSLRGLQSLDFGRRVGLPDRTDWDQAGAGGETRAVEVSEGFARRHPAEFGDARHVYATLLTLDVIIPGDLDHRQDGYFRWSDSITDARIIELWESIS